MATEQEFEKAVAESKQLTQKPTNQELLTLYGLYKQATEGDISGERPGGFDFKGIAKHDAWAELQGVSKEAARQRYVELVKDLKSRYS